MNDFKDGIEKFMELAKQKTEQKINDKIDYGVETMTVLPEIVSNVRRSGNSILFSWKDWDGKQNAVVFAKGGMVITGSSDSLNKNGGFNSSNRKFHPVKGFLK
jgi:hypothetical protein